MNELFVDGSGAHIEVHERVQDCLDYGCCIHNPSVHALRDAPLVWRQAGPFDIKPSHMERICEHGVGHPDPDSLNFLRVPPNMTTAKKAVEWTCQLGYENARTPLTKFLAET